MERRWLGTPIEELNRIPQCAPPLSHLKVVPNHTVTVRVSQQPFVLGGSLCVCGEEEGCACRCDRALHDRTSL